MGSCLITIIGFLLLLLVWMGTYGFRRELVSHLKELLFTIEPKDEPSTTI